MAEVMKVLPRITKIDQLLLNKTGTSQCTWAVSSKFAENHSAHPGALMHYLGLLGYPVRMCDASHILTF